jgi:glycosyltransferase involved in cell wall biosynthesis
VDVAYFTPSPDPVVEDRLLFIGALDWLANREGLVWFVQHVWPLVRQRRPNATFQVVGRNPTHEVRALRTVPGIEIVGTVPDVRPYLSRAAAVVVPLLVGGGTRLKIFEALAAGKAVVSTSIGCEGLPVVPGKHLLVADDPARLADAVAELLGDGERRAALGKAARDLVAERYGAETVARQFETICREVVDRCRQVPLSQATLP